MSHPEDIIAELHRVLEKFIGPDPDRIVARQVWAVVSKHQGWRPIETAPRDGSYILLAKQPCEAGEIWWKHGVGCFTDTGILWDWPYGGRPTHWQPLPPPPSSAEEET